MNRNQCKQEKTKKHVQLVREKLMNIIIDRREAYS